MDERLEYKYFVSFRWQKGNESGFGNAGLTMYYLVTDHEVFYKMSDLIKEQEKYDSVVILYWRRYDTLEEEEKRNEK